MGGAKVSLKQWRISRNLSQESLGAMVGCSREAISFIERGLRRPRPDLATRIYAVVPRRVLL